MAATLKWVVCGCGGGRRANRGELPLPLAPLLWVAPSRGDDSGWLPLLAEGLEPGR